jgi:glutamate synthase domain-containing protein 3
MENKYEYEEIVPIIPAAINEIVESIIKPLRHAANSQEAKELIKNWEATQPFFSINVAMAYGQHEKMSDRDKGSAIAFHLALLQHLLGEE